MNKLQIKLDGNDFCYVDFTKIVMSERIKGIEKDDLVRRDDCNERDAGVDGPIILLVIIPRTILTTNTLDTRRLDMKK